jgi:hypothetical protein
MHPIAVLLLLALPVASIAWTVTHEEIFRELRDWFAARSRASRSFIGQKFFFALTCEFCLSHYVAAVVLWLTRFQLIYTGWLGYFVAWLSLVWIANVYMGAFGRLRLEIRHERLEIQKEETRIARGPRPIPKRER